MLDAKNNEVNTMEENKVENNEVKAMEVKNSEVKKMSNEQTTVTEEQRAEYKKCLSVFGRSAKAWVEVAEAYECLLNLPDVLWKSDEAIKGVKRPNVGKFLRAKFDVSEGRLSQYAGAYKARQELEGVVDGYNKISCDALYEIYRFVHGKDNVDGLSVKDVYETVLAAEGAVTIKTVKDWRKPFNPKGGNGKHGESVFQRLSKLIDEVEKASLEGATEELIETLQFKCNAFLDRIGNALDKNNDLDCEDGGMDGKEEKKTEGKEMACVA